MRERLQNAISRKRKMSPMKSYQWHMELPQFPGFEGNVYELSTRILSTSIPFNVFETDKEVFGNSFWYFARSVDIGEITIEVMEFEDGKTYEYFAYWQSLIGNENGTFNPPLFYKRDVSFYRLDSMKTKIVQDLYKGYFVSGISEVSNDYEANDVVRYTITLTGDSVTHNNLGVKKSGGSSSIDTILTSNNSVENVFKDAINKAKNTMSSVYDLLN